MTELEREMILADRAEQRDKLKERRLNAMQAQKAAGGSKAKKDKGRASKEAEKKRREDDEVSGPPPLRGRDRETDRQRERERQTDRHTDGERDRERGSCGRQRCIVGMCCSSRA